MYNYIANSEFFQEGEIMKKYMDNIWLKKILVLIFWGIVALFSFTVVSKYATTPENHMETLSYIEEKKEDVMTLSATATATSFSLTMLPDDSGSAIAQELARLSTYFVIILCTLYMETMLVTLTGYFSFKVIIPLACIMLILCIFTDNKIMKKLAYKLIAFALAFYMVIPTSVEISQLIEDTYAATITNTIISAEELIESIDSSSEEDLNIISKRINKVKDFISKATESVVKTIDNIQNILNQFLTSISIIIVTSCVIPILVLVSFAWLIKMLFGIPSINTKEIRMIISGLKN